MNVFLQYHDTVMVQADGRTYTFSDGHTHIDIIFSTFQYYWGLELRKIVDARSAQEHELRLFSDALVWAMRDADARATMQPPLIGDVIAHMHQLAARSGILPIPSPDLLRTINEALTASTMGRPRI